MRALVITPCTAKKHSAAPDPARAAELADGRGAVPAPTRLASLARPAWEMYAGTHHRLVKEGVEAVWARWGRSVLETAILSGGYGLLRAEQAIVPYDVTFDEFDEEGFAEWISRLEIHEQASDLAGAYDLAFYLLSGRYLRALGLPLDVPESVQQIVLTDEDSLALVPQAANLQSVIADGNRAAQRWHVKAPHVRGFLFGRLCHQIVQHGPAVLEWLYYQPQDAELLFYKRGRWRPQWKLW